MVRILRPGSQTFRYEDLPVREAPKSLVPSIPPGFEEAYDVLPAQEARLRYEREPLFAAIVDVLLAKRGGKPNEGN
jgi:hypothetical protein